MMKENANVENVRKSLLPTSNLYPNNIHFLFKNIACFSGIQFQNKLLWKRDDKDMK